MQTPTEAIVYAATGAVIKRLSIKDGTFVFGTSLVAVAADKDLVVLDRKTFAEIGRIPDGAGTTYVEGPLGARRIATFRYDGKSIGRLRLWSVTP